MPIAGKVVLHRVGRNLNRAIRTCEAFGINVLLVHECAAVLSGRLYGATGQVKVTTIKELPLSKSVLALETGSRMIIDEVDWDGVDTILLGGESSGLPRGLSVSYATIPTCGRISGLTVEAALAIALHEWSGACR